MSTSLPSKPAGVSTAAGKANQIWGDFIPVIGFIVTYNVFRRVELLGGLINKDTAIYWATGVLIALMSGVLVRQLARRQKVSPMMLFSSAIVGGFGLIGIVLQEKAFIYVKPTIQQVFMAGMIFIPLLFGKNLWKEILGKVSPRLVVTMGRIANREVSSLLCVRESEAVAIGWGNYTVSRGGFAGGTWIGLPHLSRFTIMNRPASQKALDELFHDVG